MYKEGQRTRNTVLYNTWQNVGGGGSTAVELQSKKPDYITLGELDTDNSIFLRKNNKLPLGYGENVAFLTPLGVLLQQGELPYVIFLI